MPATDHLPLRRVPVPLALALAATLLAACAREAMPPEDAASDGTARAIITTAAGMTVEIAVEIADEPSERERGLMGRTELADGEGMAFLFGGPTTMSFWMKDTLVPLSIAFWNAQGRIVAILDMAPCAAEPCPTYAPGLPYVGALEVPRGFFIERGVSTGDAIVLEGVGG